MPDDRLAGGGDRDGRLFWRLQLAGWAAYGLSTYLALLPSLAPGEYGLVLAFKVVRTGLGLAASLVLWRLLRPLAAAQRPARVVAVAVPASLVLGGLWLLAYRAATGPWRPPGLELVPLSRELLPRATLDFAFVLLVWSAAYAALAVYRRARVEERRALEAEVRLREAELALLRAELDPHFLFNGLTAVRSAIPVEAEAARDALDELAALLRRSLLAPGEPYPPLGSELETARSYLRVARLRFGERLEWSVEAEPGTEPHRVPALLLQPLVENAVKHGLRSGARPLRVRVTARAAADGATEIEVANSLGDRAEAPPSVPAVDTGVGLRNVARRLELAFPGRASFELRLDGVWAVARIRIAGDVAGAARPGAGSDARPRPSAAATAGA